MKRSTVPWLLLGALVGCEGLGAQCGDPMPVDSIEAAVRLDIENRWEGPYALFKSEHQLRLGSSGPQFRHLIFWRDPAPGRYHLVVGDGGAYALRGWRPGCDAVEEWVNTLGPLPVETPRDLWETLADIATAMNPVGARTRFLDPTSATGLTPDRIVSEAIPGVEEFNIPVLTNLDDGSREGSVSVFWSDEGYHGMSLAVWRFRFDADGVLVSLVEEDLLSRRQPIVRRLVG